METLVLVGAGGHCRSCIDVIESTNAWKIAGIIGLPAEVGSSVSGHPVSGCDSDLQDLAALEEHHFLVTLGQVKDPKGRERLYNLIKSLGGVLSVILAASARRSPRSTVGEGCIIMHSAVVGPDVRIGNNCIVNTGAILEHDSSVGNHTHISTNAVVNGNARVGDRCFVGSGAVVSHGVAVCSETVVGAGAVVIRDITEPGIYVGNPARKMK
jgi:sugar O-acyltransferase (sialic acid O-acetyltransferase NeuD family)